MSLRSFQGVTLETKETEADSEENDFSLNLRNYVRYSILDAPIPKLIEDTHIWSTGILIIPL